MNYTSICIIELYLFLLQEQKELELKQEEDPIQKQVLNEVQKYQEELLKPQNEADTREVEEMIRKREGIDDFILYTYSFRLRHRFISWKS